MSLESQLPFIAEDPPPRLVVVSDEPREKRPGSQLWTLAPFVAGLLAGGVGAWSLVHVPTPDPVVIEVVRRPSDASAFVHPLLRVDVASEGAWGERPMRDTLRQAIDEVKREGLAREAGAYYADLESGRWAGVNEQTAFLPASLFKVVVLVAWLSRAQTNPEVLQWPLKYEDKGPHFEQFYSPARTLEIGHTYSVEAVLRQLIAYSDNAASELLVANLAEGDIARIVTDLDLGPGGDATADATTTPRAFGGLFSVLFDATYLRGELSNRALELLSHSDFHDGLVAGLPPSVVVAHKFGERSLGGAGDAQRQLHDCGVVYAPEAPYVLCVMTHGGSFPMLASAIAHVSRAVWASPSRGPNAHGNAAIVAQIEHGHASTR